MPPWPWRFVQQQSAPPSEAPDVLQRSKTTRLDALEEKVLKKKTTAERLDNILRLSKETPISSEATRINSLLGAFTTIVFFAFVVGQVLVTIVQDWDKTLVSTLREPWQDGHSIPLIALAAPPANHSFVVMQCTILNGDYMGRNCTDVSAYIDYSCPELFNADDFSHYGNTGAWCLNSAAYVEAAPQPARVESTFGRARYDYVQVDLMRDAGPAQSGFMNIFIRDNTLSLKSLEWTNFVYNLNPVAWSGVEVFFKNVLTKMEGHVLGEEHSNFLTYDHQYTRFDQAGAWSAEGSA